METINKIQINGSVKTDALGNILERSTLLNIRCDDVVEAIQLFSQLRLQMDSQENIASVPEPEKITAGDLFPDTEEETDICPECGGKLIQRSGRNGLFYGCTSYPNCKYTRQI
ncbi:MAG: topoisomerase DNA-binding C4 zinc finger domain-containing protein [Bacteroidales bacterium]|nr:topoisomerase DNA-binding C4 zinc finger domain-containing protein [Bacteroidales bacterium]